MRAALTVALATLSCIASGCSLGDQPGSSLADLTNQQKRMLAIDERAAVTDPAAVGAADALARLADDYAEVVVAARSARPEQARGAEEICWDTFIEIVELREQSARAYANGASSGNLAAVRATVAQLNARTLTLNNRFNRALAEFRNDEPPGS